ncbi:MAG: WD40 repeat domain-containing protein, partial [Chloroflexi bacterium]|nr:WD40 repeat domain-containing protein [Chloroflexota bacterium]MBP7045768.1 WD40 repeat domain-containing protein [Chloroflexota bacterium]
RFALQESLSLLPKLQLEMDGSHPDASQLLFSDNGRLLISSGDRYLGVKTRLWDATNGENLSLLPDNTYSWSADTRFLVRGNWPDPPFVFDRMTQKTILTLPDPTFGFEAAFSPDNNLIAYSTDVKTEPDNEVSHEYEYIFVVHDLLADKEILNEIIEPARERTSASYDKLAFSTDGRYVAGADLLRMDIWDLTTQQIVTQFPLDVSWPEVVQFTPDGNHVVVAGYNGTQVWNLAEDVEVVLDNPLYGNVQALSLSSDGRYLAVTKQERWNAGEGGAWYEGQNGTQVWDVVTGREVLRLPEANSESSFVEGTHHLLTINESDSIEIWDVDNRLLLAQSQLNPQVATAIHPSGSYVAGVDGQGQIRLWSPEPFLTTQTLSPVTIEDGYRAIDNLNMLVYLPDGRTLATTTSDGIVRYWDSETGEEKNNFTLSGRVGIHDIAFSPDDTKVVIGAGNQPSPAPDWGPVGFTYIRGTSDTQTLTLTHEIHVDDVAIAPNGRLFATAAEQTQLWNLETGEEVAICTSEFPPLQLSFLPGGEQLVALTENLVIVCDVLTGEVVQQFAPQTDASFWKMALHPNGRLLAIAETNTVYIWDMLSNDVVVSLPVPEINRRAKLTFSPDGRYLANMSHWSSDPDRPLTVWESETWQPIMTSSKQRLEDFAFSPDSNALAFANGNGDVWVVEVDSGHEINRLPETIQSDELVFRPDGKQLAILGWGGDVLLWRWNPEDWIIEACERLGNFLNETCP